MGIPHHVQFHKPCTERRLSKIVYAHQSQKKLSECRNLVNESWYPVTNMEIVDISSTNHVIICVYLSLGSHVELCCFLRVHHPIKSQHCVLDCCCYASCQSGSRLALTRMMYPDNLPTFYVSYLFVYGMPVDSLFVPPYIIPMVWGGSG